MKNRLMRCVLLVIISVFMLFTASCTQTRPEKGYVSADYIWQNVIKNIDESVQYSSYDTKYLLNYFATESDYLPAKGENNLQNQTFVDSVDTYSSSCVSLFLKLPMHITSTNWQVYSGEGDNKKLDTNLSTKNRLEAKIYQPGSEYNYQIYYYEREDGGFYLKAFGTNKALKINQFYEDFEIQCTGKWNITCEYDQNGFLVSERFETINSHKEDDSKSVYGYAIYTYHE